MTLRAAIGLHLAVGLIMLAPAASSALLGLEGNLASAYWLGVRLNTVVADFAGFGVISALSMTVLSGRVIRSTAAAVAYVAAGSLAWAANGAVVFMVFGTGDPLALILWEAGTGTLLTFGGLYLARIHALDDHR